MKIVADTNVIISMLLWGKSLERLFVLVNERKLILYFSPATIDELFRVVHYPKIAKQTKKLDIPVIALIDRLIAASLICYPTDKIFTIKEDESDNRILEVAQEARVKFIISGDKHLLRLKKFKDITILSPEQFLKLRL